MFLFARYKHTQRIKGLIHDGCVIIVIIIVIVFDIVVFVVVVVVVVGGVAQWLECRSVAGGLSLIYA